MHATTLVATISLLAAAAYSFTTSRSGPEPTPSVTSPSEDPRSGTLATLRSLDDLTASIGFPTGQHGYIVEEQEVRNRVSHLAFDRWADASLVVGIQGGSLGVIKDIGDVRLRDTAASVFPFLTLRDGVVFDASRERSRIPDEGIAVDEQARSLAAARVHVGHVYLIRIDERDTSMFVAVRVVEHVPEQSVTIRWRML
jgi:hypothetical protein